MWVLPITFLNLPIKLYKCFLHYWIRITVTHNIGPLEQYYFHPNSKIQTNSLIRNQRICFSKNYISNDFIKSIKIYLHSLCYVPTHPCSHGFFTQRSPIDLCAYQYLDLKKSFLEYLYDILKHKLY